MLLTPFAILLSYYVIMHGKNTISYIVFFFYRNVCTNYVRKFAYVQRRSDNASRLLALLNSSAIMTIFMLCVACVVTVKAIVSHDFPSCSCLLVCSESSEQNANYRVLLQEVMHRYVQLYLCGTMYNSARS